MNSTEFLKKATLRVQVDPLARLSPNVKEALNNEHCIIDIHTHIFDKKCLTVAYILLRMLKSKIFEKLGLEFYDEDGLLNKNEDDIYKAIENEDLNTEKDWKKLDEELENIIELTEDYELFGYDLKQAIKVLKKDNMIEVLDLYLNNFSLLKNPGFAHKPLVAGVLLMDLETGWGIKPRKKLYQQIEEVKEIMLKRKILPFLPLDPRRCEEQEANENLYSLFLKAFSQDGNSFFGVKCYPSLGYLPSDIRLEPIFKICAEKNIPVLTHCGGEIVSTYKKSFKFHHYSGIIDFKIPGNKRTDRARYLNDPKQWEPVLSKHKNLKLCFGHFGGNTNWEEYSRNGHNERIQKIVSMMKNPEWNVFADFSFNVSEENLHDAFHDFVASNQDIESKILFGTDYWVVLPVGNLLKKQKAFIDKMGIYGLNLLNISPMKYLLAKK